MGPRLVFRRAALWTSGGAPESDVDVAIEAGRIAAISRSPLPRQPGEWEIEARGRLLLPGFIDAHTHLERRLARGLTVGSTFPRGHPQLEEPLRSRFERALTHADLEAAARLALAEAALAGTTTVFALCRAPGCTEGSLDRLAAAAEAIGVRAALAYGASDRDGAFTVGAQEGVRFCEARKDQPLVRGMIGVAHPDEAGDAALDALADAVSRHGLHVHAAETEAELGQGFHQHGRRLLDRLQSLGLLTSRTLAAHLNHVSRSEILALADAGCTCAFTPRAALWAEERPPRLEAALDAGAHGALGTDGVGSDASAELSHALALWRRTARPLATQGYYALERLWAGANRLHGRVFGGTTSQGGDAAGMREPGRLLVGDAADLVLVEDYGATPPATAGSPTSASAGLAGAPVSAPPGGPAATGAPGSIIQLALVAAAARVAWTVVDGKVLVREGELLGQDLRELSRVARAQAEQLWRRL